MIGRVDATIRLTTAPNFRDLGGAVTVDGKRVRRSMIYRGEAVIHPSDDDAAILTDAGIVLVCDLRGHSERHHKPNHWWLSRGVEILELDILADIRGSEEAWTMLRGDPSGAGGRAVMLETYRNLPNAAAPHLATIFRRIAAGDLPLLIHCTAGKDRTGFLSAMILHVLGVGETDIMFDYLSSGARMDRAVTDATRRLVTERVGNAVSEEAMVAITGVEAAYLERSIAAIDAEYGSVNAYLRAATGLTDALRAELAARLLA